MSVVEDPSSMTESVNLSDGPACEATGTKAVLEDSSVHPSPRTPVLRPVM